MPYILSAFADEAGSCFSEQLRICNDNSVKWIEIRGVNGKNISDLPLDEVMGIKKQIDDGGFGISSIGSPFGKIGINDDFAPHLDKFKRTIEAAHILETEYMRLFSFYIPENEDFDCYSEKVFERLEQFIQHSGNVTLCHENEKGIFGDNAERCKKIYDNFEGKIKLIFDPANYVQCGVDIEKAFTLLSGAIEYFHIKDSLYHNGAITPAGYGDGKIEWLMNMFYYANSDKRTFLSVEPHLKVFEGFAALEHESGLNTGEFTYDSNEKAFSSAVMALKAILCANAFTQTKDIERGYGEWIK